MHYEKTLSIIKPDAVAKCLIGEINRRFEREGLRIVAAKMLHLTQKQAQDFYAIHKERPFYNSLVNFMSAGPVMIQVLEGPNAVALNRQIMGATNPKEAVIGSIRADFAESIEHNAIHGSDSVENAKQEISFFFKPEEVVTYIKAIELA
jgi:nucleoside-diphosphate kinase